MIILVKCNVQHTMNELITQNAELSQRESSGKFIKYCSFQDLSLKLAVQMICRNLIQTYWSGHLPTTIFSYCCPLLQFPIYMLAQCPPLTHFQIICSAPSNPLQIICTVPPLNHFHIVSTVPRLTHVQIVSTVPPLTHFQIVSTVPCLTHCRLFALCPL